MSQTMPARQLRIGDVLADGGKITAQLSATALGDAVSRWALTAGAVVIEVDYGSRRVFAPHATVTVERPAAASQLARRESPS
jgi:hypothetical protein